MRNALAVTLACAALGCAPTIAPRHLDAMAAGDRAASAGRHREAAEAYDRAAREAERPRDRAEAEYRAAMLLARLGERDAALARLDRVAASSPDFERGARAAYEAAMIRGEDDATRDVAAEALTTLIQTRPATGPARLAVTRLLRGDDARDPSLAASLARIDALLASPGVVATALHETLRAERAKRLAEAGRAVDAIAAWRALFADVPYPQNSRWDDGHMALAALLRGRGDARGALAALDEMLAVRDPGCTGGSCDAPLFQEGAMLRGEILRDDVGDLAAAARAYREVYERFPSSRVRDDALQAEALVLDRARDSRACDVWAQLAAEFPCTRRGREGRRRAAACGRSPARRDDACD